MLRSCGCFRRTASIAISMRTSMVDGNSKGESTPVVMVEEWVTSLEAWGRRGVQRIAHACQYFTAWHSRQARDLKYLSRCSTGALLNVSTILPHAIRWMSEGLPPTKFRTHTHLLLYPQWKSMCNAQSTPSTLLFQTYISEQRNPPLRGWSSPQILSSFFLQKNL